MLAALVLMVALAAPALSMRTWPQDDSSKPAQNTGRLAYDLITAEFGAGANGPLTVVADRRDRLRRGLRRDVGAGSRRMSEIAAVGPVSESPDHALLIVEAQPAFGPTDERTSALVHDVRDDVLPEGRC